MQDEAAKVAYQIIAYLVGIVAFFASWLYAIDRWGWFIGLGLCWLPAMFVGIFAGLGWPLVAIGVLYAWSQSGSFDPVAWRWRYLP